MGRFFLQSIRALCAGADMALFWASEWAHRGAAWAQRRLDRPAP
jgi:hypothetical protein